MHGHSFRVTVSVSGPIDATLGWVVDFAELERAWQPLHELLDHRLLNEVEGLSNPTSEILAQWIYDRFDLPQVRVDTVTVHETCQNAVTYTP